MRQLNSRYLVTSLAGAIAVALVLGIPTDVIPNPLFHRMTPVRPQDYAFLATTSVLVGALLATYLLPGAGALAMGNGGLGSGVLGFLAIGCPICNKVVVALLGVSGALSWFAPLQPVLGSAAVLLAAGALLLRWRALRGCPVVTEDIAAAGRYHAP